MADEKIIFSMVGVSKTFTNQKKVLNNIYLSFFYGAKIGIIGLRLYHRHGRLGARRTIWLGGRVMG